MPTIGIIISVLLLLGWLILFIRLMILSINEQKETKKKNVDSFLYDPKTGTKFLIEQADEKVDTYDAYKIKSNEELENFDDDERIIEEISNYLKKSNYKITKIDKAQISCLKKTIILSKYSNWDYKISFKFVQNNLLFFPKVDLNTNSRYSFSSYQIMFWLEVPNINGYYFLKPLEFHEKILNLFSKKSTINVDGFAIFELKQSHNIHLLKSILEIFKNEKNIEIEIKNDNLFVKTNNKPSLTDFEMLLNKVKKIC
ncbi:MULTISPECIES: hypothetical protein [unclassified Flavobacterium]|uniref:hypothetical protein n=1 Tax=unclassified Flavobacterium TaxID=196869 RepID=UPI00057E3922|nr:MULTISPECIES: hypothetical protein [unclassified Flavobacterium]KIA91793.1 hypothetical protein OA93_23840 [Flavobacterium sp. KMS]OUL60293.1 hypothetical protein B8T70_21080 [Flavobacterium sp. AJR]